MSINKQTVIAQHPLRARLAGDPEKASPTVKLIAQRLTPEDVARCQQIAFRLRELALQYRSINPRDPLIEANPAIVGIDIAIVAALRNLDLQRMLNADELALFAEHARIQQNIVRNPLPFFPAECMLEFARNGARKNP